jgi:ATP-dependent DNA helicase DinG
MKERHEADKRTRIARKEAGYVSVMCHVPPAMADQMDLRRGDTPRSRWLVEQAAAAMNVEVTEFGRKSGRPQGRRNNSKGPSMDDLTTMTAAAFAEGGPLERALRDVGRPYAVNAVQVRYADLSAKALMGDGDSSRRGVTTCLEGDTGVGKTYGYLIPMCLHVALCKARGEPIRAMVSTHTLELQRQIVGQEFPVVAAVVREMVGQDLAIAPLKGMRNFVSPRRVAELRDALKDADTLDPETEAALESLAAHPGGDILDWLERNEMPRSVRQADICLLPGADPVEAADYIGHRSDADAADVVVLTHAMTMVSCLSGHSFLKATASRPAVDVAVFDEADRLPSAAESFFNTRISVPMISGIAENLKDYDFHGLSDLCGAVRTWMETQFNVLRDDYSSQFRREGQGGFILLGGSRTDRLRSEARDLADNVRSQLMKGAAAAALKAMPSDDVAEIEAVARQLESFVRDCDDPRDNRSVPAIRWSPVKQYASFSSIPLFPGELVSSLWSRRKNDPTPPFLRSIIMTSATLDAPGATPGSFLNFRRSVGIKPWHDFNEAGSAALAPDDFGRMSLVLADRATPHPRGDSGDGETSDPGWIAYVARALAEAKRRGGRSLVLLPSYRDTASIAQAARDIGVELAEHVRGKPLADYLPAFREDPNGMLITPAGWEGLNLPGLLSHVVIPRIPYPVIDSARNRALHDAYVLRGVAEDKVKDLLYSIMSENSRRKTKQGAGRLIRSATDRGTVWILDPRFPLPRTITSDRRRRQVNAPNPSYMAFAFSIPERFRGGIDGAYEDAEVFPFGAARAAAAE